MAFLLYGVAALLVLLLARRVRRIDASHAVLLVALPLVETGEALFRRRVYSPIDLPWTFEPFLSGTARPDVGETSHRILYDLWTQMVPWMAAARAAIARGEWPLWNPFVLAGEPLLGVYQPAVFHPLHALALLLPLDQAPGFVAAAVLLTAAVSMYLFACEVGTEAPAALFGAAAWSYSSYLQFWLGWPVALSAATLPLLLAGVVRAARGSPPGGIRLLGTGGALVLLGGNPEVALLSGFAAGSLALALLARRSVDRKRCVRMVLLGGGLACGAAAIQLLPFLEALPQTAEVVRRSATPVASPLSLEGAPKRILERLGPPLATGSRAAVAVGQLAGETAWCGALGLSAAGLGLLRGRRRWRAYFSSLAAIGLALAGALPLMIAIQNGLPGAGLVLARYGALWAAFGVVGLATLGIEVLVRSDREASAGDLAVFVAGAIAIRVAAFASSSESRETGFAVLALTIAGICVGALSLRSTHRRAVVMTAWIVVVLLESQFDVGWIHRSLPRELWRPDLGAASVLEERPGRIAAVRTLLRPNLASMYGLEDVRGYDPMAFARLFEIGLFPASEGVRKGTALSSLPPILDFLNVRSALIGADDSVPEGWRAIRQTATYQVLDNQRALERFFVPDQVRTASRDMVLADLRSRTDFGSVAWLERMDGAEGAEPNGPCGIEIEGGGSSFALRTRCVRASWVVSSLPAWKGWRVRANGRKLKTEIVNHAFVGFSVPAGEASISVTYRPVGFDYGWPLSLLSLLVLMLPGSLFERLVSEIPAR